MRNRRRRISPHCSSLVCPRIRDTSQPYRVPSGELGQDMTGHWWCNQCWCQLELMNWGHLNHWPSVRVQGKMRHAVYGSAEEWFASVAGGNQDMIDALYETLVEGKRAPLPAIEWQRAKA